MTGNKFLLWMALFIGLFTYSFWGIIKDFFGIGIFYSGNALFIFSICLFLFNSNRKSLICFLLLFVSLNNLLDELFFDATKIQYNEAVLLILAPFIWYLKTKINARKNIQ